MTRFRLPRVESTDAARALRLHAEVADRVEARRTTRRLSSAAQTAQDDPNDPAEGQDTPTP